MEYFVFEAEYSREDGTWVARYDSIEGCIISESNTWVGLYREVDDGIRCHLKIYPYSADFAEFSFDIVRV